MQPQDTPDITRLIRVAGNPGIFRKGSRYVVVWRHRGRQHKRSCRTLTEAKQIKAQANAPTSRQTLVRYASTWLDSYTGRTSTGLRDSTRETYRDAIERVIIPYFKRTAPTLKLDDVAPTDLRQFIAELASQGLASATVRRYFSPLRAMLATAYEDGLTSRNPATGLRVIVRGEREHKPKRMTPEKTRALLAAMPAEHADMTYLMAATGLRIGETLALIWSDLGLDDDGRPVITVRTSKTAAGERTIPLSPETMRRLTKRRSEAIHSADDAPMFASLVGTAMDANNWRRTVFRPAAARAGVPWATPHSLRHGMASLMAERGFSPAQIAAHLGHADGGVLALRTYIRTQGIETPEFVDEALRAPQETG